MAKVEYAGIEFDSQLEVDYYKLLVDGMENGSILWFTYHPSKIPNLVGKRSYTPDFVVLSKNCAMIVETKGYNSYSYRIDDAIHQTMLGKDKKWIYNYIFNELPLQWVNYFLDKITVDEVGYRKIKYLQSYGFVDWDFKNPNTLANKRKEKILSQKDEIKELKEFKKNAERYFTYYVKLKNMGKLSKAQREWYINYEKELNLKYGVCDTK